MADPQIELMAHLMRRAGFGESREELEARVTVGYEASVEELLNPESREPVDLHDLFRYQPWTWKPGTIQGMGHASWLYRMLNTRAPLEEKMALFWHGVFATGVSKVDHWDEIIDLVDMLRDKGMGSYREILLEVAKNPAMLYWLDNNENHAHAVNENWGRELLELFSMGVGAYTEDDVRECSRAFTGWTITPKLPRFPMGRFDWFFEFRDEDHDHGEKTFLGHTGDLDGDDIIDIIVQQPATAQFICRHLYNFFVADEPQVPAWSVTPPRDPQAVNALAKVFVESEFDIRSVLRALFNSDFFKEARFARLKSPAEVVISTLRLAGGSGFPAPGLEGWHTGSEWINSGSLMKRTNFFADLVGDVERPGVQAIIGNLKARGGLSPEQLVDGCLDLMGPLEINDESRAELVSHAAEDGHIEWRANGNSDQRVGEMLQLIVSLRDYQFT